MNQARSIHDSPLNHSVNDADERAIAEIEKLRAILFKPTQGEINLLEEKLNALEFRISDPESRAADTSEVLAQAASLSNRNDNDYSNALKPMIVEQFQTSSRENPEIMAEALFPILGPAIRKMIASMLSRDSNKAKRTYKFEQLFLIEKESGLPICHTTTNAAESQDADMVSGMLSAIQSFVQDAFSTQEFDSLNTLQLGELSVWIEWGPDAVIAAVIRGVAPESCRVSLQQILEDIHVTYATPLANYEGDTAPFNNLKSDFLLFMDNHDSRLKNRVRNLSPTASRNIFLFVLAVAGLFAWGVVNHLDKRSWTNFVALLDAEPGIVVTDSIRESGNYTVRGLKDPLATNPLLILASTKLDAEKVFIELEPYTALHPEFALQRISALLSPPTGATLELVGQTLLIRGATSQSWINDAKRMARHFPGIAHVTVSREGQ